MRNIVMPGFTTINRIVDSGFPLAIIETSSSQRVISLLHGYSLKHGGALYQWKKGDGIHRYGMNHIVVPRTDTASGFVSYVKRANHFGLYIVEDFYEYLEQDSIQLELLRIAANTDDNKRVIIVITEKARIPKRLAQITMTIRHDSQLKSVVNN